MTVRLKELFEQGRQYELVLLAGRKGLNRPVRWVHMVENVEIAKFLEGQEIAFTTGIGLSSQEELITLVRTADKNGASGMVVNIGPFIHQVGPDVVSYCNEHDFPLFRVPWDVRMAHIMHSFSLAITLSEKHSMELAAALENAIFWPQREELYLDYLDQNGFGQSWNYCVAVFDFRGAGGGGKSQMSAPRLAAPRQEILARSVETLITRHQWKAATLTLDHRLVMVIARAASARAESMVRRTLAACSAQLHDDERAFVGVGKVTRTARCIGKSYQQARRLVKLQENRDNCADPAFYEESGIDKLLLSVPDKDLLEDYYRDSIAPLADYDALNDSELVRTLRTYLKYSGSVKDTASELVVHRNTVSYKLNKIESLLGVSLSEFSVRERLALGLQVSEILACI
jgi:hypothetical protein